MGKQTTRCPHCSAKMVEYKHSINKQMISVMLTLKRYGGVMTMDQLVKTNLTFNQKNNFQKLQYWELIEKVKTEAKQKGIWGLTERGYRFLRDDQMVHKTAITYRNRTTGFDGPLVYCSEIAPELYRQIEDYVSDQVPRYVEKDGQIKLFAEE
jgi:hypothetical protein